MVVWEALIGTRVTKRTTSSPIIRTIVCGVSYLCHLSFLLQCSFLILTIVRLLAPLLSLLVPTEFLSMATKPSPRPSKSPTKTKSKSPTNYPTKFQSYPPSVVPTDAPSKYHFHTPSKFPTETPSRYHSHTPSKIPWEPPSKYHSETSSTVPSKYPSVQPSVVPSGYPSVIPSMEPSIVPSIYPSILPSRAPSTAPTKGPTTDSTQATTSGPSERPSESESPSTYPSTYPSTNPSFSPSSSPVYSTIRPFTDTGTAPPTHLTSVAPTHSSVSSLAHASTLASVGPSFVPSSINSFAPLEVLYPSTSPSFACETQDGFYGKQSSNTIVMQFVYELEIDPSSGEQTMNLYDQVFRPLEAEFNSFLLPTLFPLACDTNSNNNGVTAAPGLQMVVGITTLPNDLILNEFECRQVPVTAGNLCNVVRGEFTIFTNAVKRRGLQIGVGKITNALHQGMDNGAFDDAHPSIERVSFVEWADMLDRAASGGDNARVDDEPTPIVGQEGSEDEGFLVGVVVVSAGAALILVAAIAHRRRKDKSDVENDHEKILTPIVVPDRIDSADGSTSNDSNVVLDAAVFSPANSSIFTKHTDTDHNDAMMPMTPPEAILAESRVGSDESSTFTFPTA